MMKNRFVCTSLILLSLVACDSDNSDGDSVGNDSVGNLINEDNATALLLQAFEVYSGRAYDNRLNQFPYELGESAQCDNDGVTSQDATSLGFENCAIAGDIVSGGVSQSIDSTGIDRQFQDFTVSFGSEGVMAVTGGHFIACCTPVDAFSTDNLNYRLSYAGGTLQVNGAATYQRIEAERGVMGGSFSMDPPAASGHTFVVSTNREFSFDSGANLSAEELEYNRGHWLFQSGELEMLADDGSSVIVNADTGDEQTLSMTVSNADGKFSTTENWNEFDEALRWSPGAQLGSFTRDNSVDILDEVFAYYSGQGYVATLHSLPDYSDDTYVRGPDLTPTQYGGYDFGVPINVDCSGGGTAAFTPFREDLYSFIGYGWSYDFNGCVDGGNTLQGALSINAAELHFTYDSDGLSKESLDGNISFSGKVEYNPEGSSACNNCTFWMSENLQLTNNDPAGPLQIANGNTQFGYRGPGYEIRSNLSGSVSINTPATNSEWVHASVLENIAFTYIFDPVSEAESIQNTSVGKLQLLSDKGDTLILDANSEDGSTVTLNLSRPGLSTQFTRQWSAWRDSLTPVQERAPVFAY